jgi:hypothetical protein
VTAQGKKPSEAARFAFYFFTRSGYLRIELQSFVQKIQSLLRCSAYSSHSDGRSGLLQVALSIANPNFVQELKSTLAQHENKKSEVTASALSASAPPPIPKSKVLFHHRPHLIYAFVRIPFSSAQRHQSAEPRPRKRKECGGQANLAPTVPSAAPQPSPALTTPASGLVSLSAALELEHMPDLSSAFLPIRTSPLSPLVLVASS